MLSLGESQISLKFSELSMKKDALWAEERNNHSAIQWFNYVSAENRGFTLKVALYLRCFRINMSIHILNKYKLLYWSLGGLWFSNIRCELFR